MESLWRGEILRRPYLSQIKVTPNSLFFQEISV